MNKFGKKISWLLGLLFAGYWGYTLLSVLCLERSVAHKKRVYAYSNLVPAVCAIVMLAILIWLWKSKAIPKLEKMEKKKFYLLLIVISVAVFGVQLYFMKYLAKPIKYDFEKLRQTAMSLAFEHEFKDQNYFNVFRIQRPILFIFTMILCVFKDWTAVIVIGIILSNLAVLLTAQMIYKITGKKSISLVMFFLGIVLYDFSFRVFIPYTDNYVVFFVTFFAFTFINRRDSLAWKIMGAISLAIGISIKVTIAIPVIAGVMMLICMKIKDKKKFAKSAVILTLIFLCTYTGFNKTANHYFHENGLEERPEKEITMWHYFMMGENPRTLGAVCNWDRKYTSSFKTVEERNAANIERGIFRIKSRGISGNLFFFTYKNFQNYGDGCFSPAQDVVEGETGYGESLVEKLFIKKKEYNRYYALVEQSIWLLVLGLIMVTAVNYKKENKMMLYLKILILGVSAYTLIFESRAKYLYMFVPFYLMLAGMGLNILLKKAAAKRMENQQKMEEKQE